MELFEVKIPIADSLKGKTLTAYYVDNNDKVVEYEVKVKDGYATFTINHFSIYTLAEKKTTTGIQTEGTITGETGERIYLFMF